MSDYIFSATTGSQIDVSGGTVAIGTNQDDALAGVYNIGFNFVFCGATYTQFGVSSNGYLTLGGSLGSSVLGSTLSTTPWGVPVICGISRDLHTGSDGYVKYMTVGTAPSRILVAEYRVRDFPGANTPTNTTFQIRLYEGSNKFEMWYGPVATGTGSIGAKNNSNTNYVSVNAGPPAFVSTTTSYQTLPPSNQNVLYTFSLCTITMNGNIAQGGTAQMLDQDELLKTITVQRGNSTPFTPFTVTGPGCAPQTMTFAISGVNAADYSISPTSASISAATPINPVITFTPQGPGKRIATLTITAPGYTRTYTLGATTTSRIVWTPNIPQGGSPNLLSGDILLDNISIPRHQSINVTPFKLTNINTNAAAPGAIITYTIKGSSGGQYTISPPGTTIGALASNTPVITFNANGIGYINDTLTVVADGETRIFWLHAFAQAPGIEIRLPNSSTVLDTTSTLFRNEFGCIGEGIVTYPLQVTNIGNLPLYIYGVDFYKTDTAYRQGTPRYPLLRDSHGALIRSYDYIVTDTPPVAPLSANHPTLPITVLGSQTRTVYLTFIAQDRDKRFVRAFFRTNGENVVNPDTTGTATIGSIWMDMFARGVGSHLGSDPNTPTLKGVNFPSTRVGETSDITIPLYNSGECQLRISRTSVVPTSGDVDEFSIVSMPSRNIDSKTNDALLAPGESDVIVVRFKPSQSGSRRAGVRLLTNDSTRAVPGITEKGVYYLDLFGSGRTGLYGKDLDFGTVLIGGGPSEQHSGTIRLTNTTSEPLIITSIGWEGADPGDFKPDAANPWPALPYRLEVGASQDLGVTFAPQALPTGPRTATIRAIASNGDNIKNNLSGTAGTRTVTVTPTTVNFGTVTTGKLLRRTIMITSSGTMPLTLTAPQLSPGSNFSIGILPRLVLTPGQTEYLELTYVPQSAGSETATLTLGNNSSTGSVQVSLLATAVKTKQSGDVDPSQTAFGGVIDGLTPTSRLGTNDPSSLSGVTGEELINGMQLWQSVPNPARDQVEIRYSMVKGGDVALELYDAAGRLVNVLDAGMRTAGEQRVMVDVRALASGVYHYRLTANGASVSKTMTVAR